MNPARATLLASVLLLAPAALPAAAAPAPQVTVTLVRWPYT